MLKSMRFMTQKQLQLTLATFGLASVIAGYNQGGLSEAKAQNIAPTATPWPTPTAWPTPTPWPQPVAWRPHELAVLPLPIVPTALPTLLPQTSNSPLVAPSGGSSAVIYNPPHGADVTGNVTLRWAFQGQLAADEFFDIRIRPEGSNNSIFVDWTKSTDYELRPWSGWQAGAYTWQIGIIKGYMEGETKHFSGDTGRDSAAFLLKWHQGGGGEGGGGGSAVTGGGGGGGGNSSGGS